MGSTNTGRASKLFEPLTISGGKITLSHRVIQGPATRNRGVPLSEGTPDAPNRIWLADEVIAEYYGQRASKGGLQITEGIPPSLEAGAMPNVPGLSHASQIPGWNLVTAAVHSKGGFLFAQLWHAGRAALPHFSGVPTVSASATPWDDDETYPFRTPVSKEKLRYRDFPPVEMTEEMIEGTIGEFVGAARRAVGECGFDGVEVNGGNGNLIDQFLHSNINTRTDSYGGSPAKRCTFLLKLLAALSAAIGAENVGVRLEPCGLYQHTRGMERVETWSYLCSKLRDDFPRLSYVHFIEPRWDRIESEKEKEGFVRSWKEGVEVGNDHFRSVLAEGKAEGEGIPVFSCGEWDDKNCWGVVESGRFDALVFTRWFIANPDLPERLQEGHPLNAYDRSRFYGSWDGREKGYIDYPTWSEVQAR